MNKKIKTEVCAIPTAEKLREALAATENAEIRNQLASLFDEDTFVETGAYTTRGFSDFIATEKSCELEGVITGYGAIDGKLAFVFAEDASRMGGAIDERHAKKIADVYSLAIKNGAPVIAIFNSNGTDVFSGTEGLAAYGKIIACVNEASGVVPQIALITGKCIGLCAAIAAMFDFTVKVDSSLLYVSSPSLSKVENAQDSIVAFKGDASQCISYTRSLISFLPSNADIGVMVSSCTDNLNRLLGDVDFGGDALSVISSIADNAVHCDVSVNYAPSVATSFATVGGVRCGIVANAYAENSGKIDADAARKISKFVNFCDSFSIPVVTLVDSEGLVIDKENEQRLFAPELARLATAYASADVPMITVIIGHAIGAAFVLLGSKALGADMVYATDNSEICALNADSGVAFAWDKYITVEKTRNELVDEWRATVASPARAAASGEIDDIIGMSELRIRICSALLMLSEKGQNSLFGRKVLPL